MIQRIQSLFLLLSSASFWVLFAFPFAGSDKPTAAFLADQSYNINDHILLLVLTVLGGVVGIIALFLFKNRPFQVKTTYFSLIFSILMPIVVIFLFYNEATVNAMNVEIDDKLGIYMPIIGLVSSVLAIRFIRKDEKTVRSMDRLR